MAASSTSHDEKGPGVPRVSGAHCDEHRKEPRKSRSPKEESEMELAGVIVMCVISLVLAVYNLWPLSPEQEERAVCKFERRW